MPTAMVSSGCSPRPAGWSLTDLTPETIDRNAWVYGTHTNVVLGRARGQIGNYTGLYRWPSAFLDRYFNTVYTNGDSEVFHR